ncbi:MAG: NAD-dependent epimerase/dehydratase family protein [Stenomitos rutilans HA7619-LM2]|jgi:nucleoside-diphosphate-sugar epimerase|nr:NAD-dependent epimerase/dehydratase family protein [Stenomitos rutilans HA7619-LM2]
MKAFVTGGSGFVGQHMISLLQEQGYEVRALARSERAAERVAGLGATVVRGDLLDEVPMAEGMQGCETVFHVAGFLSGWGTYEAFYEANVLGTERTIAVAKTAGVRRFVQIGASAVVMHPGSVLNADEALPLQTASPLPYIATKAIAEQRVIAANAPGFVTSVVRPAWIWGKGDHAVPQLVAAVKQKQFVWIDGGNYPYVTTHVRNVCHGAILAAERSSGGKAYFLGDDEQVQFREWVTQLLAIAGVAPGNLSVPYGFAWNAAGLLETIWKLTHRAGVPPLTRTMVRLIGQGFTFSDQKAREELRYTAIISREQGLAELKGVRSRQFSFNS